MPLAMPSCAGCRPAIAMGRSCVAVLRQCGSRDAGLWEGKHRGRGKGRPRASKKLYLYVGGSPNSMPGHVKLQMACAID